jgi:divalent metal cation (Fe/Co/Zn/Cd) transporter
MSTATLTSGRMTAVRRGKQLEYFTILWNSLEAIIALVSGFLAGSVALVGFGLDSLIEVTSGGALLWRLHYGEKSGDGDNADRVALRVVGVSFIALALYVGYECAETLLAREAPERSLTGIVLAAVSLVVMPVLARGKRRVANQLGSGAMHADAKQTDFCTYLSAILLAGLGLNAAFGWWWADPIAGLVMVPIIAKEGVAALKGKSCCGGSTCH